jgi:hypothetical protein
MALETIGMGKSSKFIQNYVAEVHSMANIVICTLKNNEPNMFYPLQKFQKCCKMLLALHGIAYNNP